MRTAPQVKCALNGSRSPAEHGALPVTPDALAREARAAVAAGATSLHLHARDAGGHETFAADAVAAAVGAVRAACPGVPVDVTTAAWILPAAADRLAAIAGWVEPLPDAASVNLAEDGAEDVMRALLSRGIGVEAGLAVVEDVERLAATGLADRCERIMVETDGPADEQVARALAIDQALDARGLGGGVPRLHDAMDEGCWPVLRQAAALGRELRVGLEDVLVGPDGRPAAGNGELVAAAVALAQSTSTWTVPSWTRVGKTSTAT